MNEKLENYDCVGHYKWMPKINLADAGARDYFITVGKYWIRNFHIDGWRLDVADEAPTQFWEHFSDAIKRKTRKRSCSAKRGRTRTGCSPPTGSTAR